MENLSEKQVADIYLEGVRRGIQLGKEDQDHKVKWLQDKLRDTTAVKQTCGKCYGSVGK